MAVRDDIKAQREKLKGAPFRKKAAYYLYYYKIHIVVIALIAIVAASIIHSQVTTKPAVFTAMFINVENTHTTDDTDQLLEKKVADIAGIDTSKNSVDMDMTSTLTPGGARDQMDLGILSKIQARTMNKELDVMAADAWNFNYLAGQAYFTDLRTVLSDKELARYSDDIYYVDKTELDKLAKKMQDPDYVQQNVEPRKRYIDDNLRVIKKLPNNHSISFTTRLHYGYLPGKLLLQDGNSERLGIHNLLWNASSYFRHKLAGIYLTWRIGAEYNDQRQNIDNPMTKATDQYQRFDVWLAPSV